MRLFIAEKPKMGQAIAKSLPGPHSSKDGYVETGGGIVTWCIGHLLETAPPDAYDPKYEKFPGVFEDLPIVPQDWKLQVSGDKGKQVNVIKGLLKKCTEVVNAGDPGREGQVIIDELLEFLGNKKPVLRILLNALDDASIKKELNNLHDNTQFQSLYMAGMGRQRADWLIGMNMSRAYTILGSKEGFRGVLSVGRVQSPTLAIVVNRDLAIDSFIPKDYWTIKGFFNGAGSDFWANWMPPGSANPSLEEQSEDDEDELPAVNANRPAWLDESNRIIDETQAKAIAAKVNGQAGVVVDAQQKRTQEQQPLGFDLLAMQVLANSKWNASVQETLQACQTLYEKGYTTYPRTDCCYLPESQHGDGSAILATVSSAYPQMAALVSGANASIKSRAWNDAKLGEHHAIIPTKQAPNVASLSPLERNIYETVCLRFIAQFYPPAEVDKARLILDVKGERFSVSGRSIAHPGWRAVYGGGDDSVQDEAAASEEKEGDAILPPLKANDPVQCKQAKITAKKTTPPSRFTQGTLLEAMKKVHLLVDDPALRKKLKSVEGIGRSATRAAIVETLLKRNFLEPKGKQIISTQIGKSLIAALPKKLIDPALTAQWESVLDSVATGKVPLDAFMSKQVDWLRYLVNEAKGSRVSNLPQGSAQPAKPTGKSSASGKAAAGAKKPAAKAKPAPAGSKPCPKCKKGHLVKRVAKTGANAGKAFYGCSNYPDCKYFGPADE